MTTMASDTAKRVQETNESWARGAAPTPVEREFPRGQGQAQESTEFLQQGRSRPSSDGN
jgi:hypothetical protein